MDGRLWHVYPTTEAQQHDPDDRECWCEPTVYPVLSWETGERLGSMVVHQLVAEAA